MENFEVYLCLLRPYAQQHRLHCQPISGCVDRDIRPPERFECVVLQVESLATVVVNLAELLEPVGDSLGDVAQ